MYYLHSEKYKRSLREISRIYHIIIESSVGRLHTVKRSILKFIHGFIEIPNKIVAGFFFFFFVEVDKQILNIYGKENKSKKLKKIKLVLLIEA